MLKTKHLAIIDLGHNCSRNAPAALKCSRFVPVIGGCLGACVKPWPYGTSQVPEQELGILACELIRGRRRDIEEGCFLPASRRRIP